ncbi:MAG: tetratricopeptide repeat protein [Polyangiaceae bacterium]|nr:tetratricopeptide repeat protein [Polyangiaceae bacterium]
MGDDDVGPQSGREVSAEDFLFHLYRGSELLQDDRVHEAKQELENALALQPRDAKGQDLLAIVYFRLGLYPRAIAIYTELIQAFPDATTPRINLALCYLKTGQPSSARAELEHVIQRDPHHSRAWGYLGLAFQRLGDAERAVAAFQAGGHHVMARRLTELSQPGAPPPAPGRLTSPEREVVSRAATEAFDELERGGAGFRAELGQPRVSASGTWAAVEPGREHAAADRKSFLPSLAPSDSLVPPPSFGARSSDPGSIPLQTSPLQTPPLQTPPLQTPKPSAGGFPSAASLLDGETTIASSPSSTAFDRRSCAPPPTAESFARNHLLVFPRDHSVGLHDSGCVLIRAGTGVAARFDAVRAMSFGTSIATRPLVKKTRGRDGEEPLGIAGAPILALDGVGELVLGPPAGTKLFPIALSNETVTVRESALVALDGDVVYESARLPNGDGDFIAMVNLRGTGTVTLALPVGSASLEVTEGRTLLVRAHAVLGWLGRVSARALAPSESPTRARGLVAMQGEGMVLVDGR